MHEGAGLPPQPALTLQTRPWRGHRGGHRGCGEVDRDVLVHAEAILLSGVLEGGVHGERPVEAHAVRVLADRRDREHVGGGDHLLELNVLPRPEHAEAALHTVGERVEATGADDRHFDGGRDRSGHLTDHDPVDERRGDRVLEPADTRRIRGGGRSEAHDEDDPRRAQDCDQRHDADRHEGAGASERRLAV